MKEMMENLLKQWCDKLVDLQINDPEHIEFNGGIACPACGLIHGRCGDAMYPMVYMYSQMGDEKYLKCAKGVFEWTMNNCLVGDGVIINDVGLNSWIGITVFTAMQLGDIILHHKSDIDSETFGKWYDAYLRQIEFVYSSPLFDINDDGSGAKTNVNYIFGKLAAMAGAYEITGDEKYKNVACRTAGILKNNFFDSDGFIFGECKPANARSPKGCGGIDVGYNVEESLSALAVYVRLSGDAEMKAVLMKSLRAHSVLMLPDGGWDNSWSVRNAKWSYWGSRTSDGCHVAYCSFAAEEPMFSEIAYRNLRLLEKCTYDGLLYGGPMYRENGYRACVHHTFCHAKSLCWVLDNELYDYTAHSLPCDECDELLSLETAGIYLINKGSIRATVSCYDFETVPFGHAGGGTLTMLYEQGYGPVIAAGMIRYATPEPSNMQAHRYGDGASNVPGFVYHEGDVMYVSSNSLSCESKCLDGDTIRIKVDGALESIRHDTLGRYSFDYEFSIGEVRIHADCNVPEAVLVLPVIASRDDEILYDGKSLRIKNMTVEADCKINADSMQRRIFNLTPGFSAVPFEFSSDCGKMNIVLRFE